MFCDINSEATRRLTEAKSLLNIVKNNESIHQSSIDSKILKGTFFVLLYGAIEYTITASVQRSISILNDRCSNIQDLKSTLYALVFHNECNAIIDAKDKKWIKRYELFSKITSNKTCNIDDCLFPTSTGNIKHKQIEAIWNTFGISAAVVHESKIIGRLSEIADNRNKIAHGRELASSTGANYSTNDIECIYNDISRYCSYIITVFEDYINHEEFKKVF